jgi:hypothetical protein
LADLPLPPQDLDPDPDQDFALDPAPDPHQNNADPQPWAQLSKDCCRIYNYVQVNTKEQQTEEKCCNLCFLMYRVAAIFPEQFQSFTVALKKFIFNEFLA